MYLEILTFKQSCGIMLITKELLCLASVFPTVLSWLLPTGACLPSNWGLQVGGTAAG